MTANELKIGNYFDLYGNVAKLHPTDFNKWCKDFEFKDFSPIPLTEEWLLKFGFKKDIDTSYHKNDFSLFLDKRFKTNLYLQTNDSDRKFAWFGYECKVQHVHQLQNLYFALTGEELLIK